MTGFDMEVIEELLSLFLFRLPFDLDLGLSSSGEIKHSSRIHPPGVPHAVRELVPLVSLLHRLRPEVIPERIQTIIFIQHPPVMLERGDVDFPVSCG